MYAEVIIPIAIKSCYIYSIPEELQPYIKEGLQVIVPLGTRIYTGIVYSVCETSSQQETKDIITLCNKEPLLHKWQLKFWRWLSDYYVCELGEVMSAALPTGFNVENDTIISIANDNYIPKNTKEINIINQLIDSQLSIKDLVRLLPKHLLTINKMIDAGVLDKQFTYKQKFRPKTVNFLTLANSSISDEDISQLPPKQQHALVCFIDLVYKQKVTKRQILSANGVTPYAIQALIKKGYLAVKAETVFREAFTYTKEQKDLYTLSPQQDVAINEIRKQFTKFTTVLFHGITSSGKTEIYTHLIDEQLNKGRNVLFLLPEIALTTQLSQRLIAFFGKKVLIYHSSYSDNERVEVWQRLQQCADNYLVVGTRSAVFLPFSELGLIIVDEEHEASFKQYDPAPRYHGRDVAIYLAHIHKSNILLGSATPSMESYFNVQIKKYGFSRLDSRYSNIKPPCIELVDIAEFARKKQMKGVFSPRLLEAMQTVLEENEQIILFQNRRGYAPFVMCAKCNTIPYCPYCDVSMSLHKYSNTLRCHYCNHIQVFHKSICNECSHYVFKPIGAGTEQIEEQLKKLIPDYICDRIDFDTTKGKHSYEKIINRFAKGSTQILIGTQMVAKGLDFDNVGLVGILNADLMLHFPDFRAYERSFQMLMQVSGRAGRKHRQGKVLIQTYHTNHPVLQWVKESDCKSLYINQVNERLRFRYPPVYNMILIKLKHKKQDTVRNAAIFLCSELKKIFKHRVSDAHTPLIARMQTYYLQEINIKIERKGSYAKAKQLINNVLYDFRKHRGFSSVHIGVNVDV